MPRFFIRPVYQWGCPSCRTSVSVDAAIMGAMSRQPDGDGSCPNCGCEVCVWLDADGVARVDIEAPEPDFVARLPDEPEDDEE